MIKISSEKIFRHINVELKDNFTLEMLDEFCKKYDYTYGVLKFNEDGLFFTDGSNTCQLDFLSEIVNGDGDFAKYVDSLDNEELYKTLDIYLNKLENQEYDIIYINNPTIKIRRV